MIKLLFSIVRIITLIGAAKRPGRYFARRSGYRAVRRIFR